MRSFDATPRHARSQDDLSSAADHSEQQNAKRGPARNQIGAMKRGPRRAMIKTVRRLPIKRPLPARRRPPRSFARLFRRRRRTVAIVLSVLVHLFAAFLFVYHRPVPPSETVATTQRLTFDRKTPPTPKPTPRPTLPPVPVTRPEPVALPLPVPAPLARVRLAPPHVPATKPVRLPHRHLSPRELSKPAPHAPATLSDARIAQITSELRSQIASDAALRPRAVAVVPEPLGTPRHYALDTSNFLQGNRRAHGLCDPIKNWTEGAFNYYFVACNVRFSDGTYERQAVPWPVRFPPGDDPYAGTSSGEKPLAMPLPGWRLPPGETVSPELRDYARGHGVVIEGAPTG